MILNGTILSVYVNGVKVALCRSSSLSIASDFIGKSAQGNGYFKELLPSTLGWSVSVENLIDLTESTGLPSLFELITERTRFDLKITTDNEDDVYYWVGSAYLEGLDSDFPNEDVSVFSGEIIGDGVLERVPYAQLNFTITEASIIYNNLLRLNQNNVLIVNGLDTNQVALIQNGRIKTSKTFAADVLSVCAVGNNFLVTIDQSGSNNVIIDSDGNILQIYTSTTVPTDRDVFAISYGGAIYTSKTTKYVIKYVDYVEVDSFDMGGTDVLAQLAANKYGVFVINLTDTNVQKIDYDGVITTFLSVGSTDYVALASDDDYLYVARVLAGNLSILCYLDSTLKWTYSVGTYSECSMYADADRNVYICVSDSVVQLNNLTVESNYSVVDTWTPEKVTPKDIVVSPNGVIILASGQTVSGITYQL